jgi:hypothetical protein
MHAGQAAVTRCGHLAWKQTAGTADRSRAGRSGVSDTDRSHRDQGRSAEKSHAQADKTSFLAHLEPFRQTSRLSRLAGRKPANRSRPLCATAANRPGRPVRTHLIAVPVEVLEQGHYCHCGNGSVVAMIDPATAPSITRVYVRQWKYL